MATQHASGSQRRPIGDASSPFFQVKFYNLTVEPTAVQLTPEQQTSQQAGGLTQAGAAVGKAVNNLLVAATRLGDLSSSTGVTLAASQLSKTLGQLPVHQSIDLQIPRIAASMSAESTAGAPFRFIVTLTPEYQDAVIMLNSQLFSYATMCEVQWGYSTGGKNGGPIITGQHYFRNIAPKVTFGDNIQIVIEGVDPASDFARQNHCRKPWRRNTEEARTNYSIVKALIERNKPFKLIPATLADGLADPVLSKSGLFAERKTDGTEDLFQTIPDMGFMNQLLLNSGGLTYVVFEDTVKLISMVDSDPSEQVAYTFKWRQQLEFGNDVPVYSSTCNVLAAYFQPLASRGLVSIGGEEDAGTSTATAVTTSDVPYHEPTLSKDSSSVASIIRGDEPSITGKTADGKPLQNKPTTDSNCKDVVNEKPGRPSGGIDPRTLSIMQEAGTLANPQISLKCPGVPDLFPGQIVRLSGFTQLFDGLYRVHKVKHLVTSSGYDCEVTVLHFSNYFKTLQEKAVTRTVKDANNTDAEEINPNSIFTNVELPNATGS